jgi:CRP-like cAMP-binding protein
MSVDKIKLLKSLHLLDQIPERELGALGEYLKLHELEDRAVVFEEGSKGDSLFFIVTGHVRISKKIGKGSKDLAILGPGDSFGEMAVMDPQPRSARASAQGAASLFELGRGDLDRWLKSHPDLAMGFFAELVQVQSKRLRRSSSELTLLFDLSSLLLEPVPSGKELLTQVLVRVLPHLPGSWSAAAYLYNMFNEEMELGASKGDFDFKKLGKKLPPANETRNLWLDDSAFYVSLPGTKRPEGFLIFHAPAPLSDDDRNETGRTLTAVARLVTSALENISHRTEDTLRDRLSKTAQRYGSGI